MLKSFGPGEMYTALSRVKTHGNFNCIGEFKTSVIKVNKDTLPEYDPMKKTFICHN